MRLFGWFRPRPPQLLITFSEREKTYLHGYALGLTETQIKHVVQVYKWELGGHMTEADWARIRAGLTAYAGHGPWKP